MSLISKLRGEGVREEEGVPPPPAANKKPRRVGEEIKVRAPAKKKALKIIRPAI